MDKSRIEITKGQVLNIVVSESVENGMTNKTTLAIPFEELIAKLKLPKNTRKSSSDGARASRLISLNCRAMITGKWSTGAVMNKGVAEEKLYHVLNSLPEIEYHNLTSKALETLKDITPSLILREATSDLIHSILLANGV